MQSLESTFWLKQMQLGQQQLDLGQAVIASKYYEKAFTEALWLLRHHLAENCTETTVTQLVAMCRKSLVAYEEVSSEGRAKLAQLTQLEDQYSSLESLASGQFCSKPNWAFKALLEITAKLWGARPVHRALVLDSAA